MKSKIFLFAKIIIAVLAYYIVYRQLVSYNYSDFFKNYQPDLTKTLSIITAVLLVFINWLIESFKWKYLLKKIKEVSLLSAFKSVIYGITTGMITPNRTGEPLGRALIIEEKRKKAVSAGIVSSMAQNGATIIAGVFSVIIVFLFFYELSKLDFKTELITVVLSVLLLILYAVFYFNVEVIFRLSQRIKFLRKHNDFFEVFRKYSKPELAFALGYSLLRYFVFIIQYKLLLIFFGVEISIFETFIAASLTYLISTFVPSITLAEIGIRASAASYCFSFFTTSIPEVVYTSALLWIINVALPALVGVFISFKVKG